MPSSFFRPLIVLPVALLAACSVAPSDVDVHDPYEARNRSIHAFNVGLDQALLRPAGQMTQSLPPAITQPVVNFSNNVGLPAAVANGVLQGDIEGVATNTLRFLINSTVGVLGLADPAGAIGLAEHETDFGETLHVWGVAEGAYVELPLFGPSTERDAFGRLVDAVIDPLDSIGTSEMLDYSFVSRVGEQIIDRGALGDTIDSVLYESADSYAQARLIYLQNRRFELGGDDPAAADETFVDPFEDF